MEKSEVMNMSSCTKCSLVAPKDIFACDSCKKQFCKKCSDLTETEIRCYQLKKRRLTFLCDGCEQGLLCIPDILKQLSNLQTEVTHLKQSLEASNNQSISNNEPTECEEIISELIERQKRASNVVIANLKESQATSVEQRKEEDLNSVKSLLKDFNTDLSLIKVYRVGKFMPNKNRLIKVIMKNPEEAIKVLKGKNNNAVPGIKIFGDQTKKQKDYYISVKNKLEELKAKGDYSKAIKYINNKPTIISKNSLAQKN